MAAGGAFKDAPYEGFDYMKFPRSILIGALEAPIVAKMAPKLEPQWLFFIVVGTERITTELYKVARKNRPNKFSVGEWGEQKCCTCH